MGKCIVVARVEEEQQIEPGQSPSRLRFGPARTTTVRVPKAMVWRNDGGTAEVEKAKVFARREGYRVFLYPLGEEDPLGRARADVLLSPRGRRP